MSRKIERNVSKRKTKTTYKDVLSCIHRDTGVDTLKEVQDKIVKETGHYIKVESIQRYISMISPKYPTQLIKQLVVFTSKLKGEIGK